MKYAILGVFAICLVLIAGVYALGPHTRMDSHTRLDRGPDCVYYFGPGNSCLVDASNCDTDGSNTYIMLDESSCIGEPTKTTIVAEPEPTTATPPPLPIQAAPAPTQTAEETTQKSYLGLLIPLLLLFAIAVILLLLWLDTRGKYTQTKSTLTKTRTAKTKAVAALAVEKRKKTRAYCPRDGTAMRKSGSIKQGPRGGQRQTYVCPKCSHRTMKTVKP